MAMRITTKMMQSRSLNNINTNKALQEKLTTQLSTGKKITRPSDDPIVAIRSLKLNSSLNKVDQYYEKNSEDAESWLKLTESALDTTSKIITSMKQYLTQTVSNYYETTDKQAILENLSNFIDEIYATGNADSAGRSIFTGYRTNTPLTFTEDKTEWYSITEQWTNACLDTTTFVKTGDLSEINEGNFTTKTTDEYDVESYEVARIRLAYNDLYYDTANNKAEVKLTYLDATQQPPTEQTLGVTDYYESADDEAYEKAHDNPDAIVYIAETGELLLGENIQKKLAALSADSEIRISYEKSNWKEGDLDPIHYFYTERKNPKNGQTIYYNEDKIQNGLEGRYAKQIMEYDIGSNQTIRVNTTADEVYTHDMGRDIAELKTMLEEYQTLDDTYTTVKKMIESGEYTGDELDKLNKQLAALDKARTLAKEKAQQKTESLQTTFSGYLNQVSQATTDVGSRESRLSLIQNRLSAQQTNFQELVSENEDADITDLAIQLSSVQLTYEAALSSISYVMQTSLLDFI